MECSNIIAFCFEKIDFSAAKEIINDSYFELGRMNGEKDNNNTYGGSYTGVMFAPCSFAAYEDEDFGNEIIEPRYEVIANILISFFHLCFRVVQIAAPQCSFLPDIGLT